MPLPEITINMEGMPRKVSRMKMPRSFKAPRVARDVSSKDPTINLSGNNQGAQKGSVKVKVSHPHVRNSLVNSFPEVTAHQQRIVQYTDATSEISIGGRFMNGAGMYFDARKIRS